MLLGTIARPRTVNGARARVTGLPLSSASRSPSLSVSTSRPRRTVIVRLDSSNVVVPPVASEIARIGRYAEGTVVTGATSATIRCPSTLMVAGVETATLNEATVATAAVPRTSRALGRSGFTLNFVHVLRVLLGDYFFDLESQGTEQAVFGKGSHEQ